MAGGSDSPGHPALTAASGGDSKVRFWGEVTLRHSENEVFFKSFIWSRRQLGFSQEGKKLRCSAWKPFAAVSGNVLVRGSVSARAMAGTTHPWSQQELPGPGPSSGTGPAWLHWQILTVARLVLAAERASLWLLNSSLEGRKAKSWILLKTHTTNTCLKTESFSQTDWAPKPTPLSGPAVLWHKGKPKFHFTATDYSQF